SGTVPCAQQGMGWWSTGGRLFFFSSRRRHTRSDRDWSSDVCSSDLALGERIRKESVDFGQLTLEVDAADFLDAAKRLRDEPELAFSELLDVVGVDYEGYNGWSGPRFEIGRASCRERAEIRLGVWRW